jgi:hypothetical protein
MDLFHRMSPQERCRVAAGDFSGELPSGAEVYILDNVIQGWPDGEKR